MSNQALEQFVSGLVRSLPPAEESVTALLEAATHPKSRAETLDIIRQDNGLAMNLLHLANATCYRRAGTAAVDTIEDAFDLLGIEPLVMLVGTSYCMRSLRPAAVPEKLWVEYERHGREIAESCTLLAQRIGLPPHECQMYTVAGLTHDIGRAVIMVAQHPESASLIGTPPDSMPRLVQQEQADYGMNHCEIGGRIFQNWRFSKILCEGILRHHTPVLQGALSFSGGLIFLSHFLKMSDFTGEIISQMLPPELLKGLDLTCADITEVRRTLLEG